MSVTPSKTAGSVAQGNTVSSPYDSKEYLTGLERGLSVLLAFNQDHRQLTLADIARAVGLPRATARRAVNTLEHLGFLANEGRLFRLTPKVLMLASAYATSNQVTTLLQPACEQLSREFDEDCSAAVFDGGQAVRIAHASPPRLVSMVPGIGFRLPAYCTALGRALLSQMPEDELQTLLVSHPPQRLTPYTELDPGRIRLAVRRVATDGYALVDREAEEGFRSIAVPIANANGRVVAALNIGVRVDTTSLDAMRERFLPRLRAIAHDLRRQLL
ncbi:MAG: IclR family transcriptional regulator C-terminal domain-containing protein [Pigmentiphaga sp.]